MAFYPSDAPARSTLECSIFGPGAGECIVGHLGDGSWIVVDSCLTAAGRPVALEYLEAIGVAPSAISLVVATHWHDDHIRGISTVLKAAPGAEFACSAALRRDEFITLVASAASRGSMTAHGSGVDEMSRVLRLLKERKRQPRWSAENHVILRNPKENIEVASLSPSSATLSRSLVGLAEFAPRLRANLRVVPSVEPNETSVVLHVKSGRAVALLGADLETTDSQSRGWKAIVASAARPPERARFYKVAHHGSKNADHEGIWTELLEPRPVAALTPFARSLLPTASDLTRIKAVAGDVFQTSFPVTKPLKRRSAVDRTVRESAKRPPVPQVGKMGQVRVRLDSASGRVLSCDIFGAAFAP